MIQIIVKASNPTQNIIIPSDFNCKILHIEKLENNDGLLVEIYENMFYSKQSPIFKTIMERIKFAWNILIGKDYKIFDMWITPQDTPVFLSNLQNALNQLSNTNESTTSNNAQAVVFKYNNGV